MSDPLLASDAWEMGNLGLSTVLRNGYDADSHDVEDLGEPPSAADPWWIRLRGRSIRWSLGAAVFLAYVNHWPGGH